MYLTGADSEATGRVHFFPSTYGRDVHSLSTMLLVVLCGLNIILNACLLLDTFFKITYKVAT